MLPSVVLRLTHRPHLTVGVGRNTLIDYALARPRLPQLLNHVSSSLQRSPRYKPGTRFIVNFLSRARQSDFAKHGRGTILMISHIRIRAHMAVALSVKQVAQRRPRAP